MFILQFLQVEAYTACETWNLVWQLCWLKLTQKGQKHQYCVLSNVIWDLRKSGCCACAGGRKRTRKSWRSMQCGVTPWAWTDTTATTGQPCFLAA